MDGMNSNFKYIATGILTLSAFGLVFRYFFNNKQKNNTLNNKLQKDLLIIEKSGPLTKNEAIIRAQFINDVKYTLYFQLNNKKENIIKLDGPCYDGVAFIEFNLKDLENLNKEISNIFLDFNGKITKFLINSNEVDFILYHKNDRIYLDKNILSQGENKILIEYRNIYSDSSLGLRSYIDTEDIVNNLVF